MRFYDSALFDFNTAFKTPFEKDYDSINDSITQRGDEIQKESKKNPKDSKAMQSIDKKYTLLPKEELFDFSEPIRLQKDKKESND